MRARVCTQLWLALVLTGGLLSCDCAGDNGSPADDGGAADDADADASDDDAGDADSGGPDAAQDAAAVDAAALPWPDGWKRPELLPESCDAWVPQGNPEDAARHLRFEPCEPPQPGCEQLVIDWRRTVSPPNAVLASTGFQTWGKAPIINISIPYRTPSRTYEDFSLYRLDGTPVAVWRIWQTQTDPADGRCRQSAVAWHDGEVALAFWVRPGTFVSGEFEVSILIDELGRIQRASEPRYRLGEDEVLSRGNVPDELLYDGRSVAIQGELGHVYLGSMNGQPWGQLATCPTGDSGNGDGMLYDGALYWAGSPCEGPGWMRLRRRLPDASANETFMEREDGHLIGLRADASRAAWIEVLDWDPIDGRAERSRVRVAETGGAMNPDAWSPRVVREHPILIAPTRPILTDGMYAYIVRRSQLELLDLDGNRRLQLTPPDGTFWSRLLHLGPEYLFVVTASRIAPFSGLRRYRIDELEGWEPIE